MASNLAALLNFVQGYVEQGAKLLVFSSPFLLVLQMWVTIVMVIVTMSGQAINCKPSTIICICMDDQGIFMLEFHVGGLIVSCGRFWWFGGSNMGVGGE